MKTKVITTTLAFLGLLHMASAQYPGWQHTGSFYILTNPEGADLPATATEEGFPLLLRLDKDAFDFTQAQAKGEDLRFAAAGKPLAYQIEEWNATGSIIWLRIPTIKGNAHQKIDMFWGKSDAKTESNGKAVFNESNGYVSVWHLDDRAGILNLAKASIAAIALPLFLLVPVRIPPSYGSKPRDRGTALCAGAMASPRLSCK